MPYAVDFNNVSTVGLESSPVADALAGLRANEARYFKTSTTTSLRSSLRATPRRPSTGCTGSSGRKRGTSSSQSPPLEATAFEVENIRMAYVFYESGLSINVMYTLDDPKKRAVGFKLSEGMEVPTRARPTVQVRETEVEARRNHPRFLLRRRER